MFTINIFLVNKYFFNKVNATAVTITNKLIKRIYRAYCRKWPKLNIAYILSSANQEIHITIII